MARRAVAISCCVALLPFEKTESRTSRSSASTAPAPRRYLPCAAYIPRPRCNCRSPAAVSGAKRQEPSRPERQLPGAQSAVLPLPGAQSAVLPLPAVLQVPAAVSVQVQVQVQAADRTDNSGVTQYLPSAALPAPLSPPERLYDAASLSPFQSDARKAGNLNVPGICGGPAAYIPNRPVTGLSSLYRISAWLRLISLIRSLCASRCSRRILSIYPAVVSSLPPIRFTITCKASRTSRSM